MDTSKEDAWRTKELLSFFEVGECDCIVKEGVHEKRKHASMHVGHSKMFHPLLGCNTVPIPNTFIFTGV